MNAKQLLEDRPEWFAFHGAKAVRDYTSRILEAAARKGGAAVNVARKPKAKGTFKFKVGEVHIVGFMRSATNNENTVVRYCIEGKTHQVELKPNDPRHNPDRFKAWLEKECATRGREARVRQARDILHGKRVRP